MTESDTNPSAEEPAVDQEAPAEPEANTEAQPETEVSTEASVKADKKSIAAGGDEEPTEGGEKTEEPKSFWNEEWRKKIAEHAAAGDEKAFKREMKRLERISDPAAIYGMYRELEAKFDKGGLLRVPGEGASEEEVKAFHKAIGVPEDAKEYVENLSLPDGVQLGDRDKELAGDFATDMHEAGLTQSQMDKAMSWYFKNEEARAAHVDQLDDQNRDETMRALKEEFGPALQRNVNAISTLFAYAPGGGDMQNENALFNRLLSGRMADGTIIGDDVDMNKFLISLAKEVNPVATVVDNADATGKTIDEELKEISNLRRTDRQAYNKDVKLQERERELIAAQQKQQARSA
jgi:hypothetical protein